MPARRISTEHHELTDPSRRRAMKAAAATGTAALIWAEPTIKGLARRPAYANAGSASVLCFGTEPLVAQPLPFDEDLDLPAMGIVTFTLVVNDEGLASTNTVSAVHGGAPCSIDAGPGMYSLSNTDGEMATGGMIQPDGTIFWSNGLTSSFNATLTGPAITGTCP